VYILNVSEWEFESVCEWKKSIDLSKGWHISPSQTKKEIMS